MPAQKHIAIARHRVRCAYHRIQVQRMHLRRPVREEGDLAAFVEHRAPRQLGRQRQPQLAAVQIIQAQRRIAFALGNLQTLHVLQRHGPAVHPHTSTTAWWSAHMRRTRFSARMR